MAKQLLYSYADADTITPQTERGKRLLALAVKHDIYTPTGHGDDSYWHNRVRFSELVSFAAELLYMERDAAGVRDNDGR